MRDWKESAGFTVTLIVLSLIVACARQPELSPGPLPSTLERKNAPTGPPDPTPTMTFTPTSTPTKPAPPTATPLPPTPTPVPPAKVVQIRGRTCCVLAQDAYLYAGPGNADYDVIDVLQAEQTACPLGTYGDFLQVEAAVGGDTVTGFVHKHALGILSPLPPRLDTEDVPWKPIYLPECSPGVFNAATDTVTFSNRGDGYYDTQSNAVSLDAPLKIQIERLAVRGASYGSIKILGIPARQASWWQGITRLDIASIEGHYQLGIRDGTAQSFVALVNLALDADQPILVVFHQIEGKRLSVYDRTGQEIKQLDLTQLPGVHLPDGLFPEGQAYIGTSTSPQSTLAITGLRVGVVPDGKWHPNAAVGPGLAALAERHNLTIGTEFAVDETIDVRYCRTMKRDFNLVALSEFTRGDIWLGPGEYNFVPIDRAVEYATRNGWRIRGSHLVWGALEVNAIPEWILNGNFTRQEHIQILKQHIQTMVGRYKGRVHEWSIANENPSRSFYFGDYWETMIGPEYVEMAFRWAKEADPEAVLIFNDANNESPRDLKTTRNLDKMYEMVQELEEKGVPIDAVGLQMHLLLKWSSPIAPTKEGVMETMQRFGDLGVRVYITELDVALTKQEGTQAEKWAFQAQLYREMLEACLESGVCDSFTTWGISDSTSWITCLDPWCQLKEPDADPLMFDKSFVPKPAYWAVRDVLLGGQKETNP